AAQTENLRRTRKCGGTGYDPGQQFIGHSVHRDRAASQTSRAGHRHAFLESATSGPAGGSHPEQKTSGEVVRATVELLRDAGKTPVHVRRDVPGFVGNRLQHALKREAVALVAAGVCDAETIDIVVKEGPGARMAVLGPMEQSDLVGLDLT